MQELILLLLICGSAVLSYASEKQQCCKNGEVIIGRGSCGADSVIRMNCTDGRLLLRDIILNGDKVSTLDAPGFTFVEDVSQYCIGEMYRNESQKNLGVIPVALVCFEQMSRTNDIETSGILTLISVFFLAATLAVYTYLPQMRDLQGLCYICMCISMALGFLSLGVLQLSPGFRGEICTITGFLVYAWMMATFFWMNVICINMYRSVLDANYIKKTERKQFFLYSCYAWGSTLLLLMISLIANFVEGDHWKPGFGQNSCWFSGRAETWIFFYGPIAILIAANVVLFMLSSYKLWRQTRKYEVNNLNNLKLKHWAGELSRKGYAGQMPLIFRLGSKISNEITRRHIALETAQLLPFLRFLLSLKLFLVMGITWIFEIASFAHGESHIIWKIMDTFNCLQGVVIFALLVVLRRRAIKGLAQENCCLPVTRPLAEKLSPHDDTEDQHILTDDTTEVRLN